MNNFNKLKIVLSVVTIYLNIGSNLCAQMQRTDTLNSNYIGVGTNIPSERLDVSGKAKARNFYSNKSLANNLGVNRIDYPYEMGGSNSSIITNIGDSAAYQFNFIRFTNSSILNNNSDAWIGAIYNANFSSDLAFFSSKRGNVSYSTGNRAALNMRLAQDQIVFLTGIAGDTGVNKERMRIIDNGNVGVGTIMPSERLDVSGKAKARNFYSSFSTTNSEAPILDWSSAGLGNGFSTRITNIGDSTSGQINALRFAGSKIGNNNSDAWIAAIYNGAYSYDLGLFSGKRGDVPHGGNRAALNMRLAQHEIAFFTGTWGDTGVNKERMRIIDNGNIGINTNNPLYKLDVLAGTAEPGLRVTGWYNQLIGTQDLTAASLLFLQSDNTSGLSNRSQLALGNQAGTQYLGVGIKTDAGFGYIKTNGTMPLILNANEGGNVGIGTIDPKSKLHVVGIPAYASDAAAGAAGLTAGAFWQTAGHATLPNGVLMVKQ